MKKWSSLSHTDHTNCVFKNYTGEPSKQLCWEPRSVLLCPQSSLNHTQWFSNYSTVLATLSSDTWQSSLTCLGRPSLYLPVLWGRNALLARVWPACPWILPSPALFRTQAHEASFCLHWCRLNWATQIDTSESCESQTARAERGWGWNGIRIRRHKERTLSDPLAQDWG